MGIPIFLSNSLIVWKIRNWQVCFRFNVCLRTFVNMQPLIIDEKRLHRQSSKFSHAVSDPYSCSSFVILSTILLYNADTLRTRHIFWINRGIQKAQIGSNEGNVVRMELKIDCQLILHWRSLWDLPLLLYFFDFIQSLVLSATIAASALPTNARTSTNRTWRTLWPSVTTATWLAGMKMIEDVINISSISVFAWS